MKISPPLDCSHAEFMAFYNTLAIGDRVIERGNSGMYGQTGHIVLCRDGSKGVKWDTIFDEGTGMVTSITGGTRALNDT
jgi:hypothetical protein